MIYIVSNNQKYTNLYLRELGTARQVFHTSFAFDHGMNKENTTVEDGIVGFSIEDVLDN